MVGLNIRALINRKKHNIQLENPTGYEVVINNSQ